VLAAGGPAGVGERAVEVGEDPLRPLEQRLAGGGELDAARRAVEQRGAELGLHAADVLRERRLGHVEALGGAPEVAAPRPRRRSTAGGAGPRGRP